MGNNTLEQELIYALAEKPPSFVEAKRMIKALLEAYGEDKEAKLHRLFMELVSEYPINASECEHCEQDTVCMEACSKYTLEYLPEIVQFFIEEGWDNHKYGLNLLVALLYTTDTRVILDIAHRLCDAGISVDEDSWEHLLSAIAETESYVRLRNKDNNSADDLNKYYEAILRVKDGNPFE